MKEKEEKEEVEDVEEEEEECGVLRKPRTLTKH